jgi:tetratricopeptide (TPR) repeat protein
MKNFASSKVFGTQYSTIYDLETLTIRTYLFHDYSNYVELNLLQELKKGKHEVMIADLFPDNSEGKAHYNKYNNEDKPTRFLEELLESAGPLTEDQLTQMGLNSIINSVGYEWLNDKNNPKAAIQVFEYGVSLMPKDADLYDSLGEAYYKNKNYAKAKTNYLHSLKLNPKNENAQSYLKKLRSKLD